MCFIFFSMDSACVSCERKVRFKDEIGSIVVMTSSTPIPSNNPLPETPKREGKKKRRFSLSKSSSSDSLKTDEKAKKKSSETPSKNITESDSESVSSSLVNNIDGLTNEDPLPKIMAELSQTYPPPIILCLEELTNQDFPHNHNKENMGLAITESVDIHSQMNNPSLITFSKEPSDYPLIREPVLSVEPNTVNWHEIDPKDAAHKLSLIDICLFQEVSCNDIIRHTKNQEDSPKPIALLGDQFTRTVNLISFQIVTAKTEEERKILISKFLLIGRFLFETHNFNGTLQIVMAFTNPAVRRLLSEKETSNNIWKTISSITESKNNFPSYRNLLASTTCTPVFSLILSDILHDYEIFKSARKINNQQAMAKTLCGIAETLMVFERCRMLPTPNSITEHLNDPIVKSCLEFQHIDDEVLDVFSSLRKEWILPIKLESTELKDWSPWHFASLLKVNGCQDYIEPIFNRKIYSGMDIIKYMGNSNQQEKLAELGMNESMANTIISANF